jgi:hypothetical protein
MLLTNDNPEVTLDTDMVLSEFVNNYRDCPMCDSELVIDATATSRSSDAKHLSASVAIDGSKLIITLRSDYYIRPDVNSFNFTISIKDGQVICCDTANQFVSIYELHILLRKECMQCLSHNNEFRQVFTLSYDRNESIFSAKQNYERFIISDGDKYYAFSNSVDHPSFSALVLYNGDNSRRPRGTLIPYISIDNFTFKEPQTIINKLQSISILV